MHVVEVVDATGCTRRYLTPLGEDSFADGLPAEAIAGELTAGADQVDAAHFRPAELFLEFLSYVLAKHASASPGLIAEAKRQGDGWVYIIDKRSTAADGSVSPEDILGAVEVTGGRLLKYSGNPRYRVLTDAGVMQLEPVLLAHLVAELRALPRRER